MLERENVRLRLENFLVRRRSISQFRAKHRNFTKRNAITFVRVVRRTTEKLIGPGDSWQVHRQYLYFLEIGGDLGRTYGRSYVITPSSQGRLAALEQRVVENNHRISDSIIERERTSLSLRHEERAAYRGDGVAGVRHRNLARCFGPA